MVLLFRLTRKFVLPSVATSRGILSFVFLFFLCPFLAHPELDDQAPGIKGWSVGVKLSRHEKQLKDAGNRSIALAIGHALYKPVFHQFHLRLEPELNPPPWSVAKNGLIRSPPSSQLF